MICPRSSLGRPRTARETVCISDSACGHHLRRLRQPSFGFSMPWWGPRMVSPLCTCVSLGSGRKTMTQMERSRATIACEITIAPPGSRGRSFSNSLSETHHHWQCSRHQRVVRRLARQLKLVGTFPAAHPSFDRIPDTAQPGSSARWNQQTGTSGRPETIVLCSGLAVDPLEANP